MHVAFLMSTCVLCRTANGEQGSEQVIKHLPSRENQLASEKGVKKAVVKGGDG